MYEHCLNWMIYKHDFRIPMIGSQITTACQTYIKIMKENTAYV